MTDLSDDSDCFESADEGLDEDVVDDNVKTEDGQTDGNQSNSSIYSDDALSVNEMKESAKENKSQSSALQYRKRPERGKNMSKAARKITTKSGKTSLDEIFKTNMMKPDVFIQNITDNLSRNLNRGFNTIHQTSSSIKDLVINSIPLTNVRESSSRFSYDGNHDENTSLDHDSNYSDDDDDNDENNDSRIENKTFNESEEVKEIQNEITIDAFSDKMHCDVNKIVEDMDKSILISNLDGEMDKICVSETTNSKVGGKKRNSDTTIKESSSTAHEKIEHSLNITTEEDNFCKSLDLQYNSQEHVYQSEKLAETEEKTIINEEPEKSGSFKREPLNKAKVESVDENSHSNLSEKDGWESSELELEEELSANEEISSIDTCNVNVCKMRQDVTPAVDEKIQNQQCNETLEDNEGWEDFDVDIEPLESGKNENSASIQNESNKNSHISDASTANQGFENKTSKGNNCDENKNFENNTKWTGWDNFGEQRQIKPISGWNLGSWGVNALLNTANTVTQGLTNVIEAGLGAPDPKTLAELESQAAYRDSEKISENETIGSCEDYTNEDPLIHKYNDGISSGLNLFPTFGITNLVAGVTKNLVENTKVHEIGSKVLTGGLDTLESFGKKTMEVLQEGDPGLKKKRALLLGSDKPILSQVLKEAKSKAELEDKRREEKQLARLCHFETLFDECQGLIHLEALEMLSKQCELKIEQIKSSLSTEEEGDLIGILNEVRELCVIDEDEFKANYSAVVDFKLSLSRAIEPMKNEISIQKIIQVYDETETWLKNDVDKNSPSVIIQRAMSTLAELTAATVAQFHKGGELLSIKEHRKTVEEAETLLQMTGFLCCEIHKLSENFLKIHSVCTQESDSHISIKIKEETNNATSYIKDAFNLLVPVLQLGAAA